MKQDYSTKWVASSQRRKQRKYRANAPAHTKRKFVSVHLSTDLKKKYSKRSIKIRKGDKVVVMKGQHKKATGKVDRIDVKTEQVFITGIEVTRKEGGSGLYPFKACNLIITDLNLDDKKRKAKLIQANRSNNKSSSDKPANTQTPDKKPNETTEVKNGQESS